MMASREMTELQKWAGAAWNNSVVDLRQSAPIAEARDSVHRGVINGLRDPELSIYGLCEWTVPISENADYAGESACPFFCTYTDYGNRIARGQFSLNGCATRSPPTMGPIRCMAELWNSTESFGR